MTVKSFYDNNTSTFTYVVSDDTAKKCAVIDSVLDYDQYSGKVYTNSADEVIKYINDNNLTNEWILETHIHADHLTAASYLQGKIGGKKAIGSNITKVLDFWVDRFETEDDTPKDASQFDRLFGEGDEFKIGNIPVKVIHTPGHTPACAAYITPEGVFVGDTIFSPRIGTARSDFPGGSAEQLYNSIHKFYAMPDDTKLFLCHDYPQAEEKPQSCVTVGEQKKQNIMLNASTTEAEYLNKRKAKDANLAVPKLLLPSIQVNMRTGTFGKKSTKGQQFIHIPVDTSKI